MDELVPIAVVAILFVGLPWIILHYVTRWKTAASLTSEDEALLEQLYDTARRLEERLATVERILIADHPDYRPDFRQSAPRAPADHSIDRRP